MGQGIPSYLFGKSASTPTLRGRGADEEEDPSISRARSTKRTMRSICGMLVWVWEIVVVRVCGCTLRSHRLARAPRGVRLQDLNALSGV